MVARLSSLLAVICLTCSAAYGQGQVRAAADTLDDIDLLFNILTATTNGINVDDPATLARNFPGYTFADFDRDRDGEFMSLQGGLGLFDLTLAILQFNHDPIDADSDGVPGFYELECAYAGGPQLDPTRAASAGGVNDATVDCDGDGRSNLVELNAGTNPLDPNDAPPADFEVAQPSVAEQPLNAANGRYSVTIKPKKTMSFSHGELTVEGTVGD